MTGCDLKEKIVIDRRDINMSKKNNMFLFILFALLILIFIVNNYIDTYSIQIASAIIIFIILIGLGILSYLQKNKQLVIYFVLLMIVDIGFLFYLIN